MHAAPSLLNAAMLRWLDELSSQGVFTTDTDLRIRSWNKWLVRHTGVAAETVIGRPLFDVYPELETRGLHRYYVGALAGEVGVLAHTLHRWLLRIPVRAGSAEMMPQSARIAPLEHDGAVIGTITTIDDVTERVVREAEMRRQINAAEEARAIAEDSLRVKDEFLATLSHEIRTPLNAVVGWTKLLLGRKPDEATLQRGLAVIDRNAAAQGRLIEDMLDMARIVSGKLRLQLTTVDLVTATLAAIDVVMPAATAKQLQVRTDLGAVPHPIVADSDRLQQIAWNVLSNAVKFTPAGGTIDVSIETADATVRLIVRDSGEGIPPEFMPYLFDRFRQANASASRTEGGLGLGLALVRQLVELHGGSIVVQSEGRGRGTQAIISFPVGRTGAEDDPAVPNPHGHSLEAIRLMVVDDDADWREVLASTLTDHGAHVVTAASAREALDLLEAGHEQPDVLIADLAMPGGDGFSLIKDVRQLGGRASTMPAIAISAYCAADNAKKALDAGFQLYKTKPITPLAVTDAVLETLRRQQTSDS